MRETRIRRPDGRVITLTPGLKSDAVGERIKMALSRAKVKELKARGRVIEDTPPWRTT
jgi:hypothetical protein